MGKHRSLALAGQDLLAIGSAGAYGFTMASNYNTRPRAAEVMVDGGHCYVVRERERVADLWSGEHGLKETPP
jgi:diaminopimelate decarboxylase